MARFTFGGDPESFMDPPKMQAGSDSGEGGPSFIASILDALGIHTQVAKGDKKSKDKGSKDSKAATPSAVPAAVAPLPVLNQVEAAANFAPMGMRSADRVNPLIPIDPNSAFMM